MARTELQAIGADERHTFSGTFERFGKKSGYMGLQETVLLVHVRDAKGKEVTDHLWFNLTKGFQKAALNPGDVVQFNARVAEYVKGYFGRREDVYVPIEEDYKLSRPTKIKVLSRNSA